MRGKPTTRKEAPKRIRSCIACGKKEGKTGLLRVVRSPEGRVFFDPTGRASGRGAYICCGACLKKAFESRRLDNALKVKVSAQDKERIAEEMRQALDEG